MTEEGYKEWDDLYLQYESEVELDQYTLGDKVLAVPAIKGKWIQTRKKYRYELIKLTDKRDQLDRRDQDIMRNNLKVEVSEPELKKMRLKNSTDSHAVLERIEEVKFILDGLDDLVKMVTFYGNDVKTAVEYMKLETL